MTWVVACFDCSKYQQGDALGQALAYLCTAPIFLLGYTALVWPHRLCKAQLQLTTWPIAADVQAAHQGREVLQVSAAVGTGLNALLSKVLKQCIRQARPSAACELLGVCETYGMPSNHAQIMTFAAVHWVAAARLKPLTRAGRLWLLADAIVLSCLVVAVAAARVWLGYHSLEQVLAGAGLGCCLALLWHELEARCIKPRAAKLASSSLGRALDLCARDARQKQA